MTPKKTTQKKSEVPVKAPARKPTAKKITKPEPKKFYRYSLGLGEYVEAVGAKEVKLKSVKGSFFLEHPDPENPNDTYIYETTTGTRIVSSFTDEKDAIKHAEIRLKGWGQEYFDDKISTNRAVRGLAPGHEESKTEVSHKAKKPAAKTPKTKKATAPKMPPTVDNPAARKRVPRLKLAPALQKPAEAGDLVPDYQEHGRVRTVARRTGSYAVPTLKVGGSEDVASIFADLADLDREKLYVLGAKDGKVVGIHCAHIGTINMSVADPRDMVKVPLLSGADTIYIVHNHPGGQSDPSGEDKQLTGRFSSVTDNMQLKFGGHVVIGDNNFSILDRDGVIMGYRQEFDREDIDRSEQAPLYETYQEKDKNVPARAMNSGEDVKNYIKDNLNIADANKSIYILGADNRNVITCAVPLDVTLSSAQLKKQAMEILVKSNSNNFFMFTGYDSVDKLHNAGIKKASEGIGVNLYDAIVPNHSIKDALKNGAFSFRSYAEHGDMDLIKGLYIDLQKSLGKITRTEAKAVHKDLPPGGQWRTMSGHHIYVLNGKVLAGSIPAAKGAKKATKAHVAEHQTTIDKEAKAAKAAAKKKPLTGKAAIEDTLKGANNKESSIKRTKVDPKYMAEQKKKVDALAGQNAKQRTKNPTLAEQQAEAKKMLEPKAVEMEVGTLLPRTSNTKGVPIPKRTKKASEEPKDIREMIPDMMNPVEHPKESEAWKIPFSKFLEASKIRNPNFSMDNANFKNYHKRMVSKALAEGKKVPKEVLAEYPDLAPKKTKKGEVADIRTEAQKGKTTARDVGQKVWGSKKDKASLRAEFEETPTLQGLEALEEVSPEIAQTLCVKKNLLKPVNFEAEMNRGVDVEVAMAKQLIYDRIAVKPAEDTSQGRYHYMRAMQELQRLLEPAKTKDEFRESEDYLSNYMRSERPKDMEQAKRSLEYSMKEVQREPQEHELRLGKRNRVTGEYEPITRDEWKQKKKDTVLERMQAVAQAETTSKEPFFPLGTKLTDYFTKWESRSSTWNTIRGKRLTWDKYFADKKAKQEAPKKESETKVKWEKEKPAEITRTGGRKTPVQKPEDMVKTFGFRGVEFGHYVDDKAGKFHLTKSAEALHDLADILDLKDNDISLNGRLALAFGARGSGRALAHYEPDMKTINITKGGGAGSLGHEWGHAMDNILYQESVGHASNNMAADGRMGDAGSPEIKSAYDELMHAIKVGSGRGKMSVKNKKQSFYSYPRSWNEAYEKLGLEGATDEQVKAINDRAEREKESYKTSLRRSYPNDDQYKERLEVNLKKVESKRKRDLDSMVQVMAYLHKKATGEEPEKIGIRNGVSQYFVDSMMAGGGSENNYWTRPHEMFARAFETYLQDKMEKNKSHNDYLVYGAKGTREGSPYPRGEEAVAIGKAFDKLMNVVRKTGAIQKGLAFDLQKSSESFTDIFYRELKDELSKDDTGGIIKRSDLQKSTDQRERSAYNVASTEGVLYIPLNRLQTPYQTEKASNFDKIRENVTRMENGETFDPIVIGFNYEVHDGHHKLEASKIRNYTHAPCIIGEFNDIDKQRLYEQYSELWKSLDTGRGSFAKKAVIDAYKVDDRVKDKGYENGPDMVAHATGDYGDYWAQVWCIGQDWNGFWFMIDSAHDKPRLIAYSDDSSGKEFNIVDPVVPKGSKYAYALWQKVCDAWVLKRAKKLTKSFNTDITQDLVDEYKAIREYKELIKEIKDPKIRKIIAEILGDEENHAHNLRKIIAYVEGDKTALDDLEKSIVYNNVVDTGLTAFPYGAPGIMFRGIGQKEMDFIKKAGYIQTKGKGNDGDQESIVTCFSPLFSQAEGYARSNYDLYHEKHAYVLAVVYRGTENELGEIEVKGKTPASAIVGVVPVAKDPIVKGLYIDLKKSITRSEAKKIHKDLPEGGVWKTMSGHHIYIKDGKVLAGVVPGIKGAKKATKAHLAEHQSAVDKKGKKPAVHKSEKPVYTKAKGGTTSKTKGVDAKMKATEAKGLVPREVGQSDKGMAALAKGKKLRAKLGDIHSSEDTYNAYARKVDEYKDKLSTDPHKLTYSDFYNTAREYQGFIGSDEMPLNALAKMNKLPNNGLRRDLELHYNFVKRALEEGKEVPENVLKDYPELRESQSVSKKEDLSKLPKGELQDRINKMEKEAAAKAREGAKQERTKLEDKRSDLKSLRVAVVEQRKSKKRDTELDRIDSEVSEINQEIDKINSREWEAVQEVRKTPEAQEMRRRNEKETRQQTGELLPGEEKSLDQAIGAKPFDPKTLEESFYRLKYDGWDKKAVKGVPVDLGYGQEGFITSNRQDGSEIGVYFGKAGWNLMLEYQNKNDFASREDMLRAIANRAKLKINSIVNGYEGLVGDRPGIGKDRFIDQITSSVTANGLSPRYELTGEVKKDKGPQAQKVQNPKKKEENPYHIIHMNLETKKSEYRPVEGGKRVKELDAYGHFFIHGKKGDWTVSEARTGLKVHHSSSREMVLDEAKHRVKQNTANLERAIKGHIEKHGESPKTAPTFDEYVKKEVGGSTDHLSREAGGSYRRSYDYIYNGKR